MGAPKKYYSVVSVNGKIMGSIGGVPAASATDKVWLVFQGLGDIAFAYPYSIILLEIQVSFLMGSFKVA